MRATMWSRSQGTAVNCTRWVSSCMHTHSRKSAGSTPSSRSTWTRLGATSMSRGVPPGARSYWPSTLPDMKASRAPASPPVTLPPKARMASVGGFFWWSTSLPNTGSIKADIESALRAIQVGRSTTTAAGASPGACRRAVSATGCWACSVAWRTSATTWAASAAVTLGPGGTSRAPVALANSQST